MTQFNQVNLRHGVAKGESLETCKRHILFYIPTTFISAAGTAGAGSLILEFGTLSRLTGDDRFEKAAYKAFFALWNQRSEVNLVGNTVNTWTGVCHILVKPVVPPILIVRVGLVAT